MSEMTMQERSKEWQRWWDEVIETAGATPEGRQFGDSNFSLAHLGGGTSAWVRDVDDTGWRILITDSEGCTHMLSDEQFSEHGDDYWLIGAQNDDGDTLDGCEEARSVGEALAIADRIHGEIAAKGGK